jgi:small multidrug resistance pump
MGYLYLTLAILFEIAGTTAMKLSEGFTRPAWGVPLVLAYLASLSFLTLSLRTVEVGVAYAVWSGVGTALIAFVGWSVFRETLTLTQLVSLGLILAGLVGLNLTGRAHGAEPADREPRNTDRAAT